MSVYFDTSPFVTVPTTDTMALTAMPKIKDPKIYSIGIPPLETKLGKEEYNNTKNNGSLIIIFILVFLSGVILFLVIWVSRDFFSGNNLPPPIPLTTLPTIASQASKTSLLFETGLGPDRRLMANFATSKECDLNPTSSFDPISKTCICKNGWSDNYCSILNLDSKPTSFGTILNSVNLDGVLSTQEYSLDQSPEEIDAILSGSPGMLIDPINQTFRLLTTFVLPNFSTFPDGETLNRRLLVVNENNVLLSDGGALVLDPTTPASTWWNNASKLYPGQTLTINKMSRLQVSTPENITITVGDHTYSPTFSSQIIPFNPLLKTTITFNN